MTQFITAITALQVRPRGCCDKQRVSVWVDWEEGRGVEL
jgi:hypothetical protein